MPRPRFESPSLSRDIKMPDNDRASSMGAAAVRNRSSSTAPIPMESPVELAEMRGDSRRQSAPSIHTGSVHHGEGEGSRSNPTVPGTPTTAATFEASPSESQPARAPAASTRRQGASCDPSASGSGTRRTRNAPQPSAPALTEEWEDCSNLSLGQTYHAFAADVDNGPRLLQLEARSRTLSDAPILARMSFLIHCGFSFGGNSENACIDVAEAGGTLTPRISQKPLRTHTVTVTWIYFLRQRDLQHPTSKSGKLPSWPELIKRPAEPQAASCVSMWMSVARQPNSTKSGGVWIWHLVPEYNFCLEGGLVSGADFVQLLCLYQQPRGKGGRGSPRAALMVRSRTKPSATVGFASRR